MTACIHSLVSLQSHVSTNLSLFIDLRECFLKSIQHVTFRVWVLALSITFLSTIHFIICISILFLCIAEWYFSVQIHFFIKKKSIHQLMNNKRDCFQVLTVMINSIINIYVYIHMFSFLLCIPINGNSGSDSKIHV